jgi:hypothetical protein
MPSLTSFATELCEIVRENGGFNAAGFSSRDARHRRKTTRFNSHFDWRADAAFISSGVWEIVMDL